MVPNLPIDRLGWLQFTSHFFGTPVNILVHVDYTRNLCLHHEWMSRSP